MTILDYIAANPGCTSSEIAAALNTPKRVITRELCRLWNEGLVNRKELASAFCYEVNTLPFGCSNPLTHMFNQLLKEARA
ncbi:MarR family winged helix-turn-helix transcriptional regulator [Escherichia coli]|nr:MarR family winged helix-turn-helix transcriptional regulator [Escherichia coli]MED0091281.1 MarR family winged helix-turn-helix transcriptional regulator [Escherichia coli]MED0555255.1 MarR family winged helix-turn-helix transcriptional regulator [Escherichia coli]MED9028895.1 MarR family winged helix-turn-helix transcriptional regulator [Escherichia coli]MED9074284.1 MarR family winged helix-turn-helix transcriptional regulator [Escherichia coli]